METKTTTNKKEIEILDSHVDTLLEDAGKFSATRVQDANDDIRKVSARSDEF